MNISKHFTLLLIFSLLFICPSFSQENIKKASPVRFLIRGALELGGDNVAEIFFTNGEKQSVKAGQGGTIAIGGEFQTPGLEKLLFHATVGYKYVTTQADNVHIRLTRIPIQLIANWLATPKLRFGAGITSHQAIRFKTDGLGPDMDFDSKIGPTFEVAYIGIGLSYTALTYKDQFKNSYSANAVGLSFTLSIPKR